jgi:hypothetical protein
LEALYNAVRNVTLNDNGFIATTDSWAFAGWIATNKLGASVVYNIHSTVVIILDTFQLWH